MRQTLALSIITLIVLTGCSTVQESYKPLYQASPEKHEIKVKK